MRTFSIFSIGEIIGMILAAWMVISGHYPLNLDKAIPTDPQKQNSGGSSFTFWVRMSGMFFLAGIILNAFGLLIRFFGTHIIGNSIVYGIAGLTLLISLSYARHER